MKVSVSLLLVALGTANADKASPESNKKPVELDEDIVRVLASKPEEPKDRNLQYFDDYFPFFDDDICCRAWEYECFSGGGKGMMGMMGRLLMGSKSKGFGGCEWFCVEFCPPESPDDDPGPPPPPYFPPYPPYPHHGGPLQPHPHGPICFPGESYVDGDDCGCDCECCIVGYGHGGGYHGGYGKGYGYGKGFYRNLKEEEGKKTPRERKLNRGEKGGEARLKGEGKTPRERKLMGSKGGGGGFFIPPPPPPPPPIGENPEPEIPIVPPPPIYDCTCDCECDPPLPPRGPRGPPFGPFPRGGYGYGYGYGYSKGKGGMMMGMMGGSKGYYFGPRYAGGYRNPYDYRDGYGFYSSDD